MKDIGVNLGDNSYRIKIGIGVLRSIGPTLKELGLSGRLAVITNPVVATRYETVVLQGLQESGFSPDVLQIPDGEEHKSLTCAQQIYNWLIEHLAERNTPVLALGGGVIGDLAGFVAATYMRGMPLVQLPTTLLAQVDSSIGGKVAVNLGRFKNIVGAFYQPRLVVADVTTLKTLPPAEIENGLAEVIKYGIIRDKDLFDLVERNMERLKSKDGALLEEVVHRCAVIKAGIVEKDETDVGLRNILNLGHTAGHAIEAVSGLCIPHGRAVGAGMVIAALVARRMGFLSYAELGRIRSVIVSASLPIDIQGLSPQAILEAMEHDKKKSGGRMRFVLPKGIGAAFISEEVSFTLVKSVLENMR